MFNSKMKKSLPWFGRMKIGKWKICRCIDTYDPSYKNICITLNRSPSKRQCGSFLHPNSLSHYYGFAGKCLRGLRLRLMAASHGSEAASDKDSEAAVPVSEVAT